MGLNYPPMDTSRSAEEAQAALAAKNLTKYLAAKQKLTTAQKELQSAGNSILNVIPDFIKYTGAAVPEMLKLFERINVLAPFEQMAKNSESLNINWDMFVNTEWSNITSLPSQIGEDFITWFLNESLGINLDVNDFKNGNAYKTLSTLSSFLIQVPFIVASLNWAGKLLLGERWEGLVGEELRSFTHELGLNWMVGGLLENMFEQATGRELEELINVQKHPNRLEWPQLRTLFRQHYNFPDGVDKELEALGYRQEDIDKLKVLDENQLPITDVSNAWMQGLMTPDQVTHYLKRLGYSDGDVSILESLYINHASTQADSILRSEARKLFAEQHITADQFRQILKLTKVPDHSIDIEIAAVNLEHQYGRLGLSIAQIKQMRLENLMTDQEAITHMMQHGYTSNDASHLLALWKMPPVQHPKTISASKILSYLHSGIISTSDARTRLMEQGYNATDADFLTAHPTTKATGAKYEVNPSTVLQAYEDGIINVDTAKTALHNLNMSDIDINYNLAIASYKIATHNHTKQGTEHLVRGDIREAFDLGVIDVPNAVSMMEDIGYYHNVASFIVGNWFYKLHPNAIPTIPGTNFGVIPPAGGPYMPDTPALPLPVPLPPYAPLTGTGQPAPFVDVPEGSPDVPPADNPFPDTYTEGGGTIAP